MLDNYDFSKATRNPFADALNEDKTIILDDDIVDYFTTMSKDKKIPYQALINLYLTDCVKNHRQLSLSWE